MEVWDRNRVRDRVSGRVRACRTVSPLYRRHSQLKEKDTTDRLNSSLNNESSHTNISGPPIPKLEPNLKWNMQQKCQWLKNKKILRKHYHQLSSLASLRNNNLTAQTQPTPLISWSNRMGQIAKKRYDYTNLLSRKTYISAQYFTRASRCTEKLFYRPNVFTSVWKSTLMMRLHVNKSSRHLSVEYVIS